MQIVPIQVSKLFTWWLINLSMWREKVSIDSIQLINYRKLPFTIIRQVFHLHLQVSHKFMFLQRHLELNI